MRVLDLYSGLRGWSQAFEDRGHKVFCIDWDTDFDADLHRDMRLVEPSDIPWRPHIVLASPPCEAFSIAGVRFHWTSGPGDYSPRTESVKTAMQLVVRTMYLIHHLRPAFWVMENPRGLLRKLPMMQGLDRRTVWYCHYGDNRAKPTDLWGGFPPNLKLKPECHVQKFSHPRTCCCKDHDSAARATGGRSGSSKPWRVGERAKVAYELSLDICLAAEEYIYARKGG